jgi:hypothetical protein
MSLPTIQNIVIVAINKPPYFKPRYNENTKDFYLNKFSIPVTVQNLIEKIYFYNDFHFDITHINEIENIILRNIVRNDIINVFNDSIICAFYKHNDDYVNSTDADIRHCVENGVYDDNAKKTLKHELYKNLNELVNTRTATHGCVLFDEY